MENTEFVDVGKRIEDLNTEMRGLDVAAVFPLGGIILASTLKRYLSPEAVEGDGEVRVDGRRSKHSASAWGSVLSATGRSSTSGSGSTPRSSRLPVGSPAELRAAVETPAGLLPVYGLAAMAYCSSRAVLPMYTSFPLSRSR